jgi:hypothetical protein
LATPDVKDVSVALPAGVALSPSSADGLGGCSDEQIALLSLGAAACPDSSKIGTVEISTPLLEQPLSGEVFLGAQKSQDPRSGEMYRLFLQAAGSGVRVKLAGSVKADPVTGRLTATFVGNPQLPFSGLQLSFKGGVRAPLLNPTTCGVKTASATLTSWAGQTSNVQSTYAINEGCDQAGRFEPSLDAGVVNPVAGASAPFSLTLSRPDGQQDLQGLDVSLPPGLLGNVASVPLCADAQAAAGTCSSASQVGHVAVAAGGGSHPLVVPQAGKAPTAVYLAGPYKGAPFSLSIVIPAQAGPFDLGMVVVRARLLIDQHDAHVRVLADPIPTIVSGIPLHVQQVSVVLDRPGFMLNPTSCTPTQVAASVQSSLDAVVPVASRFAIGGCGELGFAPKLTAASLAKTSRAGGAALDVRRWM